MNILAYLFLWSAIGYWVCFIIGGVNRLRFKKERLNQPYRGLCILFGGPLMWFLYSDEEWWKG